MARLDRAITLAAALVLALLGFLPLANWIAGGPSVPGYRELVEGWWSGTGIVLGLAAVAALLTRKAASLPGETVPSVLVAGWGRSPRVWSATLAAIAGGLYVWIALAVFSGRPLLIDEIAQVVQARIFAGGELSLPAPRHSEFFSSLLMLNLDGKVFSQFPPGGPAMLALGALVGAEWIVGPLFGVASVLLFAALIRRVEARPGVSLGATLLFALAPFVAFMSGSHMNHVTTLTWLLVGMLGLARVMEGTKARFRDGMLLGLGFGVAATIRPGDAFVFALPAGIWLLIRSIRSGAWRALAGAGLGLLAPLAALLGVNAATTGSPFTLGYSARWGAALDIGFHTSPWGELHTPARGLELVNSYFLRLQSYLFETPVPSLVPAIGALAATPRLSPFDRYLLISGGLLVGLYFAYWHDGFYLGPRFMIPLAPLLAWWTARFFVVVRERLPGAAVARGLGVAALASILIAVGVSVPIRVRTYRSGLLTMRWDADGAAQQAGVSRALVFVRESWGAQIVARMWAAGVAPSDAEQQYRKSDACALEQALDRIERQGLTGPPALAELRPLLAESARLVISPFTPDRTNRLLPGAAYTPKCLVRLQEDQRGFTLLPPLFLAGNGDVIYARDLHARDSLLVQQYPDRTLYLLRPATRIEGAVPQFYPLQRDSLFAAWRRGE